MTRVVIADDHRIFRQGLAELLAGTPGIAVAGTAGDGEEALAAARRDRPDVLILDLTMPRLDGFAVAARLRAEGSPVRVLVLSTWASPATCSRTTRSSSSRRRSPAWPPAGAS